MRIAIQLADISPPSHLAFDHALPLKQQVPRKVKSSVGHSTFYSGHPKLTPVKLLQSRELPLRP